MGQGCQLLYAHKSVRGVIENDDEGAEEVKSKPTKAKAKPTKKPILPDSVRALQKVSPASGGFLKCPLSNVAVLTAVK